MKVRIDNSGNIIFGDDSASTSAKNMILYLISLLAKSQAGITYDEDSAIKNIEYTNGTITWDENNSGQSYSYGTNDLQTFLNECFAEAYPSTSAGVTLEQMETLLGVSYQQSSVASVIEAQNGLGEDETLAGLIKQNATNLESKPSIEDIAALMGNGEQQSVVTTVVEQVQEANAALLEGSTATLAEVEARISSKIKDAKDTTVLGAVATGVIGLVK